MPLWGWICSGLAAVVLIFIVWVNVMMMRRNARVRREGKRVLAYIMMANDTLYEPQAKNSMRDHSFAQVLFELDAILSEEKLARLAGYGEALKTFDPGPNPDEDSRIIGSVMRTQVPYSRPLRLPASLTDGVEAYTASLDVYWSMLPEGKLTLPYIYCLTLVGPTGAILQADYPTEK